jgi:tetratricopeptide (TPR) repeat protein
MANDDANKMPHRKHDAQDKPRPERSLPRPPTSPGSTRPRALSEPSPSSVESVDDLLGMTDPSLISTAENYPAPDPITLQRVASEVKLPRSSVPPPLPQKTAAAGPPLPPVVPPPLPPPGQSPAKASVRPPPPLPAPSPRARPPHPPPLPRSVTRGPVLELLQARVASLEGPEGDRLALSRALVEMAVLYELTGEDALAITTAEAAAVANPDLPETHGLLRRKQQQLHPRGAAALVGLVDREIPLTPDGPLRVALLAERARLLSAADRTSEALIAWSYVLAHDPQHAAALRGKEAAFVLSEDGTATGWEAQAEQLSSMAEAYVDDPHAAAWLLVERATILELRLFKVDEARRALTMAVELDPRVGPVRRALVRHVARHRDAAALVDLLDEEGRIEADPARAARLELEAASIAIGTSRETAKPIALLMRAAGRAPTSRVVDLRVLSDLIRLLEASGRASDARPFRRARLAMTEGASARAEELRALARLAEHAGDREGAIRDLEASLVEEADPNARAELDRLLAATGRHEPRIALWITDAARARARPGPKPKDGATEADAPKRVEHLLRAAAIAERALGRPEEAVKHLRTAWTVSPGHPEVLEALTRLLSRPATAEGEAMARLKMELYAHSATVATDAGRKIAYLEKSALLAEELLLDFTRAAAAYDAILELEPGNLGALLGLARNAARTRDDRALHRALLAQARVSRSESEGLELRTRAAAAIAEADPAAALSLASEVVAADASHVGARNLVTRLHETAGRWELVARSLEEILPYLPVDDLAERQRVLLYLAEVQALRLRAPRDALATLRRAREADPTDPSVQAVVARTLESIGEPAALREAYETLAAGAPGDDERASHLVRAAEIAEHRLRDDVGAVRAYEQALLATPGEPWIADRLERVRARVVKVDADVDADAADETYDQALELVIRGADAPRARALLEAALARGRSPFATHRLLERLHRSARAYRPLSLMLAQEAEVLRSPLPRKGALWALAEIEEWRLDGDPDPVTYARILALDPDDPEALHATLRIRLPAALAGDEGASRAVLDALRRLTHLEPAGGYTSSMLILAHLLEATEAAADHADVRELHALEALEQYRALLSRDPASVTAAWGVRRLAHRLGRPADAVAANEALAALTSARQARGRYLFEAAELVAGAPDGAGLGDASARRARAASLLERALEQNPDGIAAASALIKLRGGREPASDLLGALRRAMDRATDHDAIIYLGTEVARIARDDLHDLGIATLAMQKVRAIAPTHAQSLLTLSELYLAQRAWPEAVEALESVVAHAGDAEPRLTALFALGSIYDKVLARPEEHERVLRTALAIEPGNARALRSLIEHLRARRHTSGEKVDDAPDSGRKREVASLLLRLARAETEPARRCDVYLEASDLEAELGDTVAAERSIILAIVHSPASARAFARLAAFFRRDGGLDAAGYARALQALISRGREAGLADARWFAALGQLEVDTLKRLDEGIAHLEWAVQIDPSLHETRYELADAYARTKAKDQAIRVLMGLITPDARPLMSLADASVALELLERLFEQEKRPEEAVVVSELRAIASDIEQGRADWLAARALAPLSDHHAPFGRAVLIQEILPKAGRHVLLEVAAAATGLEAKLLRTNLQEVGVHGRDRIGSRSGHPLRPAFDRALAVLGVTDLELVMSPAVDKVRVIIQDTPWVLVPMSFEALAPRVQVAGFARAAARALLGVPWLGELREPAILGWLVAVARQVVPMYAAEGAPANEAAAYEAQVGKAIGRRQKKALEPLVSHLAGADGRPPELSGFLRALDQCTLRAAYVASGDLAATARAFAFENRDDAQAATAVGRPGLVALAALLGHPVLGDTARFALSAEATSLRQRAGSVWAR